MSRRPLADGLPSLEPIGLNGDGTAPRHRGLAWSPDWECPTPGFGSNPSWVVGDNTTNSLPSNTTAPGPNIAAIVAPTVILGLLAIASAVLVWLFCVVRKKRQTEGTYRPSAEEQTGASSVETPDALKLPKEERLI